MKQRFTVSVPASSGNLGPGFDVLGLAVNLRNELRVEVLGREHRAPVIDIEGEGEDSLATDATNLVFRAIQHVFIKARASLPWLDLFCVNRIPLARGLGSSSAAVVAGLVAGNTLLGRRFDNEQILSWAAEFEGHPDNVAPALLGGVRASGIFEGRVVTAELPVPRLSVVAAIPDFELSTARARQALPRVVPLKDVVFNLSAVSLMSQALDGRPELLGQILNDRLHEPYRARLVPGFYAVKKAALKAGASGVILSGAGPTMVSFAPRKKASAVAVAMARAFKRAGVSCRTSHFSVDRRGAVVR